MGKNEIIESVLTRGVSEVIDGKRLRERLLGGRKLRVKLGIDPTSPNLHIGRAVSLLKLRDLQELGHDIVLIIGNFTGIIGDTSDKESERPMLTVEAVEENMRSYFEQAGKIVDMDRVEKRYNADWLGKLTYMEIGNQADQFSVAEFIARDNIRKRLESGKRVSLREMLYPLMQGYDSVAVRADVELGGTDQRFNLLAGRTLQTYAGQEPQDVLMVNLIPGTDGRKMSSSWGNTINLTDEPNDMFGKVMSVPDGIIASYFVHCTRVPLSEVEEMESAMKNDSMNPRDAKLRLAHEITSLYHGPDQASAAQSYFVETFSRGQVPIEGVVSIVAKAGEPMLSFLVTAGLAQSKSDARRKIRQGGVSIGGVKVDDEGATVDASMDASTVKVGKRGFAKIIVEQ